MSYTLWCIFFTSLLGLIFKLSERFGARALFFIPFNYLICFFLGFAYSGNSFVREASIKWIPYTILIGGLFIIGFNLFGKTIRNFGISTATLFQKMSVVLTVFVAILFGDHLNWVQFIGILIGIIAMFLILKINLLHFQFRLDGTGILFISLFLASCIEISFILIDKHFNFESELKIIFQSYIFLVAGILGFVNFAIKQNDFKILKADIIFGLLLGIPNFFSIYFLMMALDHEVNGSLFFPILNCSVISITLILGNLLFKERFSYRQLSGLILSMISIFMIFYFKT